jgi:pimeloyl-ACP methyl ester carboxylesterase
MTPSSEIERNSTVTVESPTEAKGSGQYADVNGINLYYQTHGTGRPLILLHGGLGSGEMFEPILPALTVGHQGIVPDLQGHGRTADIDRPISVEAMAEDIAALIGHLGLDRPDIMGYSLGGGVAFMTAVRHPELVHRLIVVSVNMRRDAIYPEMLAQQGQVGPEAAEFLKDTPMYQVYARVAPRPEDFPRLLGKMGESMAKDFDLSDEVRTLKTPTLFAAADADMFPPSHAVEVFELLGGGQRDGGWMGEGRPAGGHALAILPGVTHYNSFTSPALLAAATQFLDAPEA